MTTAKSNPIQTVQPYLFFDGRCEEAIEFYRSTLGAEVAMLSRFKDCPDPNACAPGTEDKVMHASLRIGDTILMASDGQCQGKSKFEGFSLSLTVRDEVEAGALSAVRLRKPKLTWTLSIAYRKDQRTARAVMALRDIIASQVVMLTADGDEVVSKIVRRARRKFS